MTPKAVTVTANDNKKVYGAADPELTAKVEGTLGTDTVAYEVARAEGEDVGTYTITASGEAEQGNYTVTYKPGSFEITKAETLSVEGKNYKDTYDGLSHGEAAEANVTDGTTVYYSTDGGENWGTEVPQITNVGKVTVRVKAENANYVTAT